MDTKPNYAEATDGTRMISEDSWLEPYAPAMRHRYLIGHLATLTARYARYQWLKSEIEKHEGGLLKFSEGYKRFGFNRVTNYNGTGKNGILYREWAAGAQRLFLFGEFNGWNRDSHEATKDDFGVFSLFLPDHENGQPGTFSWSHSFTTPAIQHATKVKISLVAANGQRVDRIPAWIKVVWQQQNSPVYDGVYWNPPQPFQWKHQSPVVPTDLRIYECHVGMSSQEPKINTYIEFARDVLPWVVEAKYNAIQLMAIMEHAYYASFGYQVTNFFAVSSRFGTPDELKGLIDRAHELGLIVLLDIVHSHASKNVDDGLNQFDGTDHLYFHEGGKGYHPIWDSRLFNYGNWEVLRFLMSNARWFIDEYHFDGFRFDGVTSMIYTHHGVAHAFTRGYDEYYDSNLADQEAITYLTLVNDMLHQLRPKENRVITVAEEVSGFVGMCRPIEVGGIGFDYRLNMGIPDKWIELLSKVKDEDWNMGAIAWTLTNRRHLEANIAYCESHDQALVGDKTIAFWLMDKDMYWHMSVLQEYNPVISRGIALHKIIRLITCALGGEGYLNFMGNEFGHPEWIDFPREGNKNSYHHARRRWDLAKDHLLRYQHLWSFDKAMLQLESQYKWLPSPQAYVTLKHEGDKIISFERAGLFFVFSFHPEKSFTDYRLGVSKPGKYRIVLDSDAKEYGGHERINKYEGYFSQAVPWHGWEHSLLVYIPNRTGLVFALDE